MSGARYVLQSLLHHWRMNLAVALGVAVGTAVLTGALLVGDSMRGSLQHLALDRLSRVELALISDHFFRARLATELVAEKNYPKTLEPPVPLLFLAGAVSHAESARQANHVTILGCDEGFWKLGDSPATHAPPPGEVFLNRALADRLDLKLHDEVIVRLARSSDIPADSPLGKKADTVANRRLKVTAILPTEGLGRFGLHPTQQLPLNAYANLAELQSALGQRTKVNALLIAGRDPAHVTSPDEEQSLRAALRPTLVDYGLGMVKTKAGYFQLTSQRMVLEPAVEEAAQAAFGELHAQPVFTYLANDVRVRRKSPAAGQPAKEASFPYSTISALDPALDPPLGPFVTTAGEPVRELADDKILLNQWAADDLAAQGVPLAPGDEITFTYFEPESTHGQVQERTATLRLQAIVKFEGSSADKDLTPELVGVTDEASIADWNPPFPYDSDRVRTTPPNDIDERYWDEHRATPKAFVNLATGRKLWRSRFGQTTSIRIPSSPQATEESLAARLKLEPSKLGFVFRAVKRQGLEASVGTTGFSGLFLGFSMFIIASAVMLVAFLYRLGIEQRADQVGILLAIGWRPSQILGLLFGEGALVAAAGGALGLGLGLGYAALMLTLLHTWWLAAVTTPFLQLHIGKASLPIGYASGVVVSLAAIAWTLWQMRHVAVRRLLDGEASDAVVQGSAAPRYARWTAWSALVLAVVALIAGTQLGNEAQAGAFVGAGSLVLTAALALLWMRLRSAGSTSLIAGGQEMFQEARFAARNGARHPGRSTLMIGLVATASFLIIAISAFRLEPPRQVEQREGGTGGFALIAESDQPLYPDDKSPAGRRLAGKECVLFRVQAGDDASCLNLFQPLQPRVLGVPSDLVVRGGFAWASSAASNEEEQRNPWRLLDKKLPALPDGRQPVPVVLDMNTATYSLHLSGVGAIYQIAAGRGGRLTLQVVGLLKNSLFQGDLLIGESAFQRAFPDTNGSRLALCEAPPGSVDRVADELKKTYGDLGLQAERTDVRLARFLAVQNTYLSTFQSLGGLGLLLGTLGLAVVEIRNVLERRAELALLRAAGFGGFLLARLVMWENVLLLLGGLGIGVGSAAFAIMPHLATGGAAIPWGDLALTLLVVLVVGILAGLVAVRALLKAPLLVALRGK